MTSRIDAGTPQDPERTPKAQEAYDDFLRGLEMINQQEYLKGHLCGKRKKGNVSIIIFHDSLGVGHCKIMSRFKLSSQPYGGTDVLAF